MMHLRLLLDDLKCLRRRRYQAAREVRHTGEGFDVWRHGMLTIIAL